MDETKGPRLKLFPNPQNNKDGSKEEAPDMTAGGNGLFHERRTKEVE